MIDRVLGTQAVPPVTSVEVTPAVPVEVAAAAVIAPPALPDVPVASVPVASNRPAPVIRRQTRRANLDALPPGIAARLAKLSGKTAPAEAGAAPVEAPLDNPAITMPGKSAAE